MLSIIKKTLLIACGLMVTMAVQELHAQGKHNKVHQIEIKEKPVDKPPKVPTPAPHRSPRNKRVQS